MFCYIFIYVVRFAMPAGLISEIGRNIAGQSVVDAQILEFFSKRPSKRCLEQLGGVMLDVRGSIIEPWKRSWSTLGCVTPWWLFDDLLTCFKVCLVWQNLIVRHVQHIIVPLFANYCKQSNNLGFQTKSLLSPHMGGYCIFLVITVVTALILIPIKGFGRSSVRGGAL